MNAWFTTIGAASYALREVLLLLMLSVLCALIYCFIRMVLAHAGWRRLLLTAVMFMPLHLLYQGATLFIKEQPQFPQPYVDRMTRLAGSVPVYVVCLWLLLCACFLGWLLSGGGIALHGHPAGAEFDDKSRADAAGKMRSQEYDDIFSAERILREAEQDAAQGRMQDYSQAVSRMVVRREVLCAKRSVHADMGRVLLMTKRYLAEAQSDGSVPSGAVTENKNDGAALCGSVAEKENDGAERAALIEAWREVVSFLRTGTHEEALPDVKKQLLDAADAAGVTLIFRAETPVEEDALRDYVKDASAKIIAAVREGRASVEI